MMTKKIGLTVYLSHENIQINDCFDQDKITEHSASRIDLKRNLEAKMYAYKKESPPPTWSDFIDNGLTPTGKQNFNQLLQFERFSISSCLAMPIGNRFAVVCFGHGSSLVNWKSMVNNFGKKVILNTVDVNRFISVRSSHYERHPRFVESQSSITSNLYEFELDFELQMLAALTGDLEKTLIEESNFEEKDIGLRITGSNSLSFTTYRDIEEIRDILIWFCGKYEEDIANDFFDTIDTIQKVEETFLKEELSEVLLQQIQDTTNLSFQFIVPTLINYSEYQTFKFKIEYRTTNVESAESSAPNILNFRAQINHSPLKDILTIDHLKRTIHLICISNIDNARNLPIPAFNCLTGEIEYQGNKYTLMGGKWYKIEHNFYTRIVTELNAITFTNSDLTPFDPTIDIEDNGNLSEGKYNSRQNIRLLNSLLLDKEKITFRGRGTVEACDLIYGNNFYHVKRYSASSTLSHLFFQGSVSASAMLEDQTQYQTRFLQKIQEQNPTIVPQIRTLITTKAFSVVYTILIENSQYHNPSKQIENLPGFSIISLYKAIKDLRRLGLNARVELLFHNR